MRGRRSKDARSRISRGRRGRSDYPDSGACSAACDAHGAIRPGARHRPSMGWLWLGLAPGARSLEPVERGMGSAALRAKPLLRGLGSVRRLERPLRRLERSLWGWARPLRRLATLRRRLLIHSRSGLKPRLSSPRLLRIAINLDCPEVHACAEHGYTPPDRDIHDKKAANRDWELIYAMFRRQLSAKVASPRDAATERDQRLETTASVSARNNPRQSSA
jgi:hypothetical protein